MPDKSHKNVRHVVVGFTRWIGSPQSIVAHTLLFAGCFFSAYTGLVPFDRMLLVLTTLVSLEAIYLAIFIQMSINSANDAIEEVEHDIDEIQEDVEKIEKDVDEIQEDVEGIEKDVDEIQEDVEEITEEEKKEMKKGKVEAATLEEIQKNLRKLMRDIESLQHKS
jgi:septal ring factor EnvC (AmiA/AmiB activator)